MKTFYRRNLPHLVPPGAVLFITFRLKHSIPLELLEQYYMEYHNELISISTGKVFSERFTPWSPNCPAPATIYSSIREAYTLAFKKFFLKVDRVLDKRAFGSKYLQQPKLANVVSQKLHSFDKKYYWLVAYTILPNHVHVLLDTYFQIHRLPPNTPLTPENYTPYEKFMNLIKGVTARQCNQLLNKTGSFWQKESWDHMIRNEQEYYRCITYILNNLVKANLASRWQDHPHTWLCPELQDLFKELHP